ncbi:uncharacterized protein LOC144887542 [Branchiostoma floridae x Branchiostoma japonicum]
MAARESRSDDISASSGPIGLVNDSTRRTLDVALNILSGLFKHMRANRKFRDCFEQETNVADLVRVVTPNVLQCRLPLNIGKDWDDFEVWTSRDQASIPANQVLYKVSENRTKPARWTAFLDVERYLNPLKIYTWLFGIVSSAVQHLKLTIQSELRWVRDGDVPKLPWSRVVDVIVRQKRPVVMLLIERYGDFPTITVELVTSLTCYGWPDSAVPLNKLSMRMRHEVERNVIVWHMEARHYPGATSSSKFGDASEMIEGRKWAISTDLIEDRLTKSTLPMWDSVMLQMNPSVIMAHAQIVDEICFLPQNVVRACVLWEDNELTADDVDENDMNGVSARAHDSWRHEGDQLRNHVTERYNGNHANHSGPSLSNSLTRVDLKFSENQHMDVCVRSEWGRSGFVARVEARSAPAETSREDSWEEGLLCVEGPWQGVLARLHKCMRTRFCRSFFFPDTNLLADLTDAQISDVSANFYTLLRHLSRLATQRGDYC